jgi:tRNA modification GTPase
MHLDDTIVAIATPPGRGGIGVLRLAGPDARQIAESLLRLRHALEPGAARFGELIDPASGERIDEVVATYFAKPHSYTTDDIVEISAHGSPVVLEHALETALRAGARLADPGEFTMRAFLNRRIDLTQAEAVRDLIEAQTLYQAKVAAQQLEGALSGRLKPIKQKLVDLIAVLEAGIDFAEDDVAVMPDARILEQVAAITAQLESLLESFAYGRVVHQGLTLAIVGRPNVGKSSLFNRLVERERAIVTASPGTTRDVISETVAIGGIPVKLVDTAGIRVASDEAESIGIRKSWEALAEADVVLVVVDVSVANLEVAEIHELLEKAEGSKRLIVFNKADIKDPGFPGVNGSQFHSVFTSARTGEGVDQLKAEILQLAGSGAAQQERGFLTNIRHRKLVEESLAGLGAASSAVHNRVPHEMLLMDLYAALRPLDAITGATTAEDILNQIFSTFCIGK